MKLIIIQSVVVFSTTVNLKHKCKSFIVIKHKN